MKKRVGTKSKNDSTPKCEVITTARSNFTIIKDKLTYMLTVKMKEKTIDLFAKVLLSPNSYEGIYTYDDFLEIGKVFYSFESLEEIYLMLIDKLNENKIDVIDEDDVILLKFDVSIDSKKREIILKLNKNPETNLAAALDDMSKVVLKMSDNIKKLEEKFDSYKAKSKSLKKSVIISKHDIGLIKNWIDEKNYEKLKFKLLFRASKHGRTSNEFHNRCDNKGKTLTLIKTTNNIIIGGYTTLKWDSSSINKSNDLHAFVFSLTDRKKYTCNKQSSVIYCCSSNGPSFGGSGSGYYDISINSSFSNVSNGSDSYGKNEGINNINIYYLLSSSSSSISDVEVYLVTKLE
jgi:hypothetical protein